MELVNKKKKPLLELTTKQNMANNELKMTPIIPPLSQMPADD